MTSQGGNGPTPAGWYADASAPGMERFFDGNAWTSHTRPQNSPEQPSYAAGWYPDTTAPGTERYFDGVAWTPQTRPLIAQTSAPSVAPAPAPAATEKKSRKGWIIGGSIAAGVILIGAVGAAAGAGNRDASTKSSSSISDEKVAAVEKTPTPEPPAMIAIPSDLVGKTALEAASALDALGLQSVYDGEDDAKVVTVSPAGGVEVELGSTVSLTLEQKPKLTLAQENAVGKAEDYLSLMGFSRKGLIDQLEFEGYSRADAKFAVDYIAPNWNEEAAEKAQSYLDTMSFSRSGLKDQLLYEGFTPDQVHYALKAVGY